jgi:hypothetical protein
MTTTEQYNFLKAINGLFEGTLSDADTAQIAKRLAEDSEASELYLEFLAFDIGLEWSYGKRSKRDILTIQSTLIPAPAESHSSNRAPLAVPIKGQSSSPAILPQQRSLFSRPVLQYVALVALCLYGTFAIVAWNLRPDQRPKVANANDVSVAKISSAANVRWSRDTMPKVNDSPVRVGQSLKIESGTIELALNAGTRLIVEGPADWSIDGDNSATLIAGKLSAKVSPRAVGFTLDTPTTQIVDLGTEFGVEVDESGQTDISVYTGNVTLQPKSAGNLPRPIITLRAGQSKRVASVSARGDVVVTDLPGNAVANLKSVGAETSKSHFSRWQAQRDRMLKDPSLRLYLDFQEGAGNRLRNIAKEALPGEIHSSDRPIWFVGRWPGKKALPLGASYSHVTVPSDTSLDIGNGDLSLLVSVWFDDLRNPTALIAGRGDWPRRSFSLWTHPGSTREAFFVWSIGGANGSYYPAWDRERLRTKQWYLVVGVVEGDHTRLFVNGREACQPSPIARPIDRLETPLEIGRVVSNWASGPMEGLIDELAIFSRALSAEEVLAIYELRLPAAANRH